MNTPFQIEHIKDGNYLRVNVSVPVTRDLADEFTQQSEEMVERLGCSGVLVDVCHVPNVSTVNDNYEFSAWDLKVTSARAAMKRAILTAADDDTHDLPILAMQTMGYNVKKFTDEQAAIAWLTTAG